MEDLQPHSKAVREIYFLIGVLATISYRAIIIFSGLQNQFWLNLCWYVGTIGFVIYFYHRYLISEKRAKTIRDLKLDEKVSQLNLNPEDKGALEFILKSLKVSSEKWIYIIIFVTSGISLFIGIYMDFIAK